MHREPKKEIKDVLVSKHNRKIWIWVVSAMMAVVVFVTVYALIMPAITMANRTYCGIEEHTHTEACYTMQTVPEIVFTCNPNETADFVLHHHDEYCYNDAGELICTLTENEEHTHTEDCYDEEGNLNCTKAEIVEHQHNENCYGDNGVLICGMPQIISHQHTAECFEETDITEEVPVLTCGKKEHVHTDQCFAAPESLTFNYTDETIEGVITLPWDEALPDDLSCTVVRLDGSEDDYNPMYQSVAEAVTSGSNMLSDIKLYQLEWRSEGKSYILPEGMAARVELTAEDGADTGESLTGLVLTLQDNSAEEPSEAEDIAVLSEEPDAANDETSENAGHVYKAEAVTLENGSVSMPLSQTGSFALAKTTTTVTGNYYKRVDSLEEIRQHYNSGYTEKYVIVYANSVALAFGSDTWYSAPVEIQPVKGYENKDYFQIAYIYEEGNGIYGYTGNKQFNNPIDYKARHWQIKPHSSDSSAFYIWENENTGDELWTSYWDGNKIYLDHDNLTNTWRIHGASYYMSYDEVNGIPQKLNDKWYLAQTNMLIFRYVGGELEIQDDITGSENVTSSLPDPWTNYEYEDYQPVTDSKEGNVQAGQTPVTGAEMTYASDPATANIESEFGSKSKTETGEALYNLQKKNDGRILTDKSVVYGADDYGATGIEGYGNYDPGDFSVTLSALGQEWMVTDAVNTTAPLDVVYILDISNSMNSGLTSSAADGMRWSAAMNAINLSMKNVLERNDQNRVGLVTFSNSAREILPLDRYTPNGNGQFLERSYKTYAYTANYDRDKTYSFKGLCNIQTATGLQYDGNSTATIRSGSVPVNAFGFEGAWGKTYTQAGIQKAYDVFLEMANLSSDYLTFEVDGKTYPREPVIILITDGDPTICTYNYMYPENGPSYGQGLSYGVEGYYTILSANYFKNITSILYQRQASFFTIGIGISETDNYSKTVLDPTAEHVAACANSANVTTEKQLYDLLENTPGASGGVFTYTTKSQTLDGTQSIDYSMEIPGIGYNSPKIRGVHNPYTGKYDYCDKAWFGELTKKEIDSIFADILDQIQLVNNYNFLLKEGTQLEMTDCIGNGMAVKGIPVLRFYGVNYAADKDPVTGIDDAGNSFITYHWTQTANRRPSDSKAAEGTEVPLSGISATITTAADGSQTVVFKVPEEALPTYYPDLYKAFYYEELPVRLMYRVGLSDTEIANLQGMTGEISERVYYTSLYNAESNEAMTTAIFTPDQSNAYYKTSATQKNDKTKNTSATSTYSFKEQADGEQVIQSLGNNGKLSIKREKTLDITVKKEWASGTTPADSVNIMLYVAGTRQNEDGTGKRGGVWEVEMVKLDAATNWTHQWTALPMREAKESYLYEYTDYFIAEYNNSGYNVTYRDADGNILTPQTIQVEDLTSGNKKDVNAILANSGNVVVVNSQPYTLPHTGGMGTSCYVLAGVIIMLSAGLLHILIRMKYKKGGDT